MDPREQRGIIIAATTRIDRKDGTWLVPSQSDKAKRYSVNLEEKSCSCPDHEAGFTCKHVHAVMITLKRELGIDGTVTETRTLTVTEKVTYQPVDWPAYNAAQVNEKDRFQELLYALCKTIPQPPRPPRKPGPNLTLLADAMFASVLKVYTTLSSRRFMSDLRAAQDKGYVSEKLHYNTISKFLDNPETTPILTDLIIKASLPLRSIESDFAVDSSGFSTSRYVRWFDEKYGVERSGHDWVKVHLMCGVKTNVITSVEIHERSAHDAPLFGPLVKTTARNFKIAEVSADKAYLSEQNLEMALSLGAQPYIPFKVNSTPDRGGLWEKMYHFFKLNQEEFSRKYHKRSNVESTFNMMKAKFGTHVRSRADAAMKNEVLAKCLAHNLCCVISAMYELGISPDFS